MASKKAKEKLTPNALGNFAGVNRKPAAQPGTVEQLQITVDHVEALQQKRLENVGRPKRGEQAPIKEEVRATFIVNRNDLRKIKYISYLKHVK